jgi:RNA polymerase sigma-70 factor (ECF subfamily)
VIAEDRDLINECLAGRTDAFGELVVRYQDRLYNTLVKVLGSSDDARDAVQDAFVQAFEKLSTFHGRSAFYSWLFRIAMNAALTQKRKHRHSPASIDAARAQHGVELPDRHSASAPDHALDQTERQAQVRAALMLLPDEFRIVLVLKEMEGLKYEEIAEIIGCPVGTVRSRIHRARSDLRERLRPLLDEK